LQTTAEDSGYRVKHVACRPISAKHVACRPISAKPVPAAGDLFFIPGVNAKRENSQGAAYKGDCYG
jgi:hypothetical protein